MRRWPQQTTMTVSTRVHPSRRKILPAKSSLNKHHDRKLHTSLMLSYASQNSFRYLTDLREVQLPTTCYSWPKALFLEQHSTHWRMTDLQINSWYFVLYHIEQRCSDELLVECQQLSSYSDRWINMFWFRDIGSSPQRLPPLSPSAGRGAWWAFVSCTIHFPIMY